LKAVLDLFRTRQQAAEAAAISTDQLVKYLRNKANPSFEVMARLCRAQGVSLDWLATGEGPMLERDRGDATQANVVPFEARGAADLQLMRECVEAIEELLGELGKHATPAEKGELVTAAYRLVLEERAKGKAVHSLANVIPMIRKLT
jgi:transcriptional regulator with XRE-family HTH domain